jgi:glucose/arabinose dehydrogenase
MHRRTRFWLKTVIGIAVVAVIIAGAGTWYLENADRAQLPETATVGPTPTIPSPNKTLLPTVDIAPAKGWPNGAAPTPAGGFAVNAFATGLTHPRWLYVLPNGDVLVAESNAPADRPDDAKGVTGVISRLAQGRAGAGVPSPDRIILLRPNGQGTADKFVFLKDLHSPFGMALVGNDLYVANTDAIIRFNYTPGATQIDQPGVRLTDLPAGTINHHWTKNVIASRDGSKLYATVGSNSNAGENGLDAEKDRAAILEVDRASGQWRVFASGIRNPNGMAWEPQTGALWTVANERDELGSDLVPDYLTSVKDGAFYGWPYSYYGRHIDTRVPENREMVEKAIAPDYALGNHVAALGLAFYTADLLPQQFRGGAFIGEHGSWNRRPPSGYKVVFVPFRDGQPTGQPIDILTGFLSQDGAALGRPVGVAVDRTGALLVADDVGNAVWRVTPSAQQAGR